MKAVTPEDSGPDDFETLVLPLEKQSFSIPQNVATRLAARLERGVANAVVSRVSLFQNGDGGLTLYLGDLHIPGSTTSDYPLTDL